MKTNKVGKTRMRKNSLEILSSRVLMALCAVMAFLSSAVAVSGCIG